MGSIQLGLTCLLVSGLAWFELSSVDFGYHIAYGREFLRTGRIVDVDPFIYATQDHRFINANWLSQAAMAGLYDGLGWPALIGLRTLLIAIMLGCGVVLMARAGVGRIGVAWGLLLGALAGYERFTLRPELFSYAILALQMLLLYAGRPGAPPGWKRVSAIVALQALWVNLHSYFLLGLALSGARLAQAVAEHGWAMRPARAVDRSQSNQPPHAPRGYGGGGRVPPAARRWLLVFFLQCAACLLNPWGVAGALFPVRTLDYLRAEKIMAQNPTDPVESPWGILAEFQSPFGFLEFLGAYRTIHAYLLLLGVAALAVVIAALRRRVDVVLVILAFAAVSTQMRRNVAPFAVVAAPLAIAEWSAAAAWFAAARRAKNPRGPLTTLAALSTCALTAVWLNGVWTGRFYFEERRPARRLAAGFSDHLFPMKAIAWLNEHMEVQPRLFCDLMTTSNVLPWLRPEFKVFISTNTFAYPPDRLKRCWNLGLGLEDHRAFCGEQGVNVMLLRVHDPTLRLIRALQRDPEWALAHYDANFVVYLRRIPEHAALLVGGGQTEAAFARDHVIGESARPHAHRAFQVGIAAGVPIALGWFDAATPLIREALALEPDYFEMWNNLGLCHAAMGQRELAARRAVEAMVEFRAAAGCFQRVLAIEPGHREARYNLDHTPVRIEGAAP